MGRLHLFEWEDQTWFPEAFRNFITDHLSFHVSRIYVDVIPLIVKVLKSTGDRRIVDLCSGGGGPLLALEPALSQSMGEQVAITLSDFYPNIDAFEAAKASSAGAIDYIRESVDATNCPESLAGMRTMFTALHHFKPEKAREILADAAAKRVPIGIFEPQERSLGAFILLPAVVFVGSFLLTPFLPRLTLARIIFTYCIPLMPLFFTWDAIVSCLRTYSPRELNALTRQIAAENYQWETGKIAKVLHGFVHTNITYLIGTPATK